MILGKLIDQENAFDIDNVNKDDLRDVDNEADQQEDKDDVTEPQEADRSDETDVKDDQEESAAHDTKEELDAEEGTPDQEPTDVYQDEVSFLNYSRHAIGEHCMYYIVVENFGTCICCISP